MGFSLMPTAFMLTARWGERGTLPGLFPGFRRRGDSSGSIRMRRLSLWRRKGCGVLPRESILFMIIFAILTIFCVIWE